MVSLIRFLNSLSFDTALGAVSFTIVVSYTLQIGINPSVYLALFVSVLSIYNIDHLIDSKRLKKGEKSIRHAFYQEHMYVLFAWQVVLLIVGSVTIFYIPVEVLWGGITFLLLLGVYFLVIFKFSYADFWWREVVVALGYTLAVALVPFLSMPPTFGMAHLWLIGLIFFIALSNLWVFAIYEVDIDQGQNHHSIARITNINNLEKMAGTIIGLTIMAIIGLTIYFNSLLLGGIFLLIESVYLILLKKQPYFKKAENYRLIGECVLILPGMLILLIYGF